MGRQNDTGSKPLSGEEKVAAIRAAFLHVRLALDELERVLTGSVGTGAAAALALPERDVMKPGEYADRLRVSVPRVHGWVERGMPHFKVEGRVRIRVRDADAWLAVQDQEQPSEERASRHDG